MAFKRWRSSVGVEPLEARRLLTTTLIVNDTPGVDQITLGVTPAGGVLTIVNGEQKEYAPGEWNSVAVQSGSGADTINVRATVVPTVVHYLGDNVSVNVGDAGSVQNIRAPLNANGVVGGPARGGSASIAINSGADSAARHVAMTTEGSKQIIAGLAPAEISVGVEYEPVGPGGPSIWQDMLSLTTGGGADVIKIDALRYSTPTTLFNVGGNDAIAVGDGLLEKILSSITVWGGAFVGSQGGGMTLSVDDSRNTQAAQFKLSALYIREKGPMERIEFGPEFLMREVQFQVNEVASATMNAGSGGNRIVVEDIANRSGDEGPAITLNTGGGGDSVMVDRTKAGTSLGVNGQAGDDLFKAGPIGPFDGVNGALGFDGGDGSDRFIIQGPKVSPLDIPSVPVILTLGKAEHHSVVFRYAGVEELQIQNGWFWVREDLGRINLTVTSDSSGGIQFESSTAVQINASQRLGALKILSGPVEMRADGNLVLGVWALDIQGDASLDLADNAMEVQWNVFSPFGTIRKWIFNRQILSSRADARHNLGYADVGGGIDFAPFGTVLVKYTLYGDANLDRRVNFADLVALAQHYPDHSGNANWDQGEFTYDGKIDMQDLVLLAQNYNTAIASVAVENAAPARPAVPAIRRRPQVRPR